MVATSSRRCSTPAKARTAARMASGATPWRRPTAVAARTLETLCSTGQRDVVEREHGRDRPTDRSRPSRRPAPGAEPRHVAGDDPAILDAQAPSRRRRRARVGHDRAVPEAPRTSLTTGSSSLRTRTPSGGRSSTSRRFTARYDVDVAMAIEVVGGDVRVDGHVGAPRERRQLELGELENDTMTGGRAR